MQFFKSSHHFQGKSAALSCFINDVTYALCLCNRNSYLGEAMELNFNQKFLTICTDIRNRDEYVIDVISVSLVEKRCESMSSIYRSHLSFCLPVFWPVTNNGTRDIVDIMKD